MLHVALVAYVNTLKLKFIAIEATKNGELIVSGLFKYYFIIFIILIKY